MKGHSKRSLEAKDLLRLAALGLMTTMPVLALTACDSNDGPAEEAGEALDDAADDVGDAFDDAADEVDDAIDP